VPCLKLTMLNNKAKLHLIGSLVNVGLQSCLLTLVAEPALRAPIKRTEGAYGKFETAFRRETKWINSSRYRARCRSKRTRRSLQGQYSNLVMIHHNLEEFTMNFIYIFPNGAQGKLLNSMIVSPGHAKRIWRALGENLARYEAQFGTIKESRRKGAHRPPNVGFRAVDASFFV